MNFCLSSENVQRIYYHIHLRSQRLLVTQRDRPAIITLPLLVTPSAPGLAQQLGQLLLQLRQLVLLAAQLLPHLLPPVHAALPQGGEAGGHCPQCQEGSRQGRGHSLV